FERELRCLDDGLVTQIHGAEPELLPLRPKPFPGTQGGDAKASCLGKKAQLAEQARNRVVGADGVAGDEQDAGLHSVPEERAPVGAEQIVLVAAELEVRERVGPVSADEASRGPPQAE